MLLILDAVERVADQRIDGEIWRKRLEICRLIASTKSIVRDLQALEIKVFLVSKVVIDELFIDPRASSDFIHARAFALLAWRVAAYDAPGES